MAQPKKNVETQPDPEPEPQPEPELSVAELMIRECGMEENVTAIMGQVMEEVAALGQIGDITSKEDEQAVTGHIRALQAAINTLTSHKAFVTNYTDDKTKQVRKHFDVAINGLKKTRLGLRAALLK